MQYFTSFPRSSIPMRIITFVSLLLPFAAFAEEAKLFNGKDLTGWTSADGKPVTAGWKVEDGVLHRATKGGDLISEKEYGDFELTWEWKIAPGGNSGLKYRVHNTPGKGAVGFEYQMLDDAKHADGALPTHRTGSLYDLLPAPAEKKLNPPGEWNTSRLIVRGNHLEHWLNGQKVIDTDTDSEAFKTAFAKSKYKAIPKFGEGPKGHILLQDHGDEVWLRNLVIVTP